MASNIRRPCGHKHCSVDLNFEQVYTNAFGDTGANSSNEPSLNQATIPVHLGQIRQNPRMLSPSTYDDNPLHENGILLSLEWINEV